VNGGVADGTALFSRREAYNARSPDYVGYTYVLMHNIPAPGMFVFTPLVGSYVVVAMPPLSLV